MGPYSIVLSQHEPLGLVSEAPPHDPSPTLATRDNFARCARSQPATAHPKHTPVLDLRGLLWMLPSDQASVGIQEAYEERKW